MARKTFKCPKCDRRFSMAAHLARHKNTIHRSKTKRKAAGRRRRTRPTAAGNRRVARGRSLAIAEVIPSAAGMLDSMQTYHADLLSQRLSIDTQIDAVARAMEAMGGASAASAEVRTRGRGRPPGRSGSLKVFIVRVLRQSAKPLRPSEIGTRVKKTGYKTKAKDLAKAVSNTLPDLKQVKRVGFGLYRV